jgi:hypothetical protein
MLLYLESNVCYGEGKNDFRNDLSMHMQTWEILNNDMEANVDQIESRNNL